MNRGFILHINPQPSSNDDKKNSNKCKLGDFTKHLISIPQNFRNMKNEEKLRNCYRQEGMKEP